MRTLTDVARDIAVKPFEVLAGREYPDVMGVGDRYDSDWELAMGRSIMRRDFFGDVVRFEGVKKGLGYLAGMEYPDSEAIRIDSTTDSETLLGVEAALHQSRKVFVSALVHLNGIRNRH